jgi:phosphoribosylformylglycinamidine synthase
MALDYNGKKVQLLRWDILRSITDPVAGSRTAIAEALSNIVWAPIKDGDGISLSANWMYRKKR